MFAHSHFYYTWFSYVFHGELRAVVEKASNEGIVRKSFLKDLEGAFPNLKYSQDLSRIAEGIRATTVLHPRELEKKTGGDLGILLVRPDVYPRDFDDSVLNIDDDHQRGLLAQAKLKSRQTPSRRSNWGSLTPNQKKVLPQHLSYLSLILYEYSDNERMSLLPFRWQLCHEASINEIERWLQINEFPSLKDSVSIIRMLGSDRIGTNDKNIIQEYICPKVRRSLIIHIGWPPDASPPLEIKVWKSTHSEENIVLYEYRD